MHWLEKLIEKYGRLRLANDAVLTQDRAAVLRQGRAAVQAWNSLALGSPTAPAAGDEEMIHVGDVHVTGAASPPASRPPGSWGSVLLGAGLLATGVGLPTAALVALRALPALRSPVPVPTQPSPPPSGSSTWRPDHDTLFDLELVPAPTTSSSTPKR